MYSITLDPDQDLDLDPDPYPNWAKILDPDPNSMYLEPQHCFFVVGCERNDDGLTMRTKTWRSL